MTQFLPHYSNISVTFFRFYRIFPIHFEAVPSINSFLKFSSTNPIRKSNKLSFENNKISFSSVSPNQHFNYLLHLQKKMTISNFEQKKFSYSLYSSVASSFLNRMYLKTIKVFLPFLFIPFCSKGFCFPSHDMQEFFGFF